MSQTIEIIKIGGNVLDAPEVLTQFLDLFARRPYPAVLVHGGGKIATQTAAKLGIAARMHEGRRLTDAPMLEVVTMVYAGLVNKGLVAQLQQRGLQALGLCGADADLIRAVCRPAAPIDYGFVGDVVSVNAAALSAWLEQGLVPIVAPLTHDGQGQLLNTNADTIAAAIATALAPTHEVVLRYCFEQKGVLPDLQQPDHYYPQLDPESYATLKTQGVIHSGMIPKLDNAFATLQKGVKAVWIGHALALEGNSPAGTVLNYTKPHTI
ncbi:acetylglutamate kinase [Eisenibacter elegans]|uniref:acetylglutamate kinase n=1 Tax=Eisenibacter elegans TaxID=997 RepID=UPI000423EAC6|nr:acetylglutamate kinase [Eisenibacter elegans]